MRINVRLFMLLASGILFLGACSNQPDAGSALKDAAAVANSDAPTEAGFEVTDLNRENGWAEGEYYKIHFTYNLTTKLDYPQLVINLLDESLKYAQALPSADLMGLQMQVGLTSMLSGMSSEVTDVKKAVQSYRRYPEVNAYIDGNEAWQKDSSLLAVSAFVTASALNSYQVIDGAPRGTKIPRQVTFTYRKTEKGWQRMT